ncbi:MAG: triose-phosphate isomerase [Armatimonadota bacterium]
MRRPMMAGNWKMNKTLPEARELAQAVADRVGSVSEVDMLLCPPFVALEAVGGIIEGSNVELGGQNVYWKDSGAYTGEVSVPMLVSVGCRYVIVGHSERRGRFGVPEPDMTDELARLFGDGDESVNVKAKAALAGGLLPIICCGETLDERQAGNTDLVVREQVAAALAGLTPEQVTSLVIAYEPVWAIGTGETCADEEANRVSGLIRLTVAELFDTDPATSMRILYGGSVKPENVKGLMEQHEIDGGLVGGASLEADSFCQLVEITQSVYQR